MDTAPCRGGIGTGCRLRRFLAAAVVASLAVGPISTARSPAEDSGPTADAAPRARDLWRSGRRAAAHAFIDSVVPLARAASDSASLARLLILRGAMHTAMGDGALGVDPLREGLGLARARNDSEWTMTALRWYGVALGHDLKDAEAQAAFSELQDLARARGDREKEGWAACGLGYQSARSGDTERAREQYTRSVALFRETGEVRGELMALNGLGTVLGLLSDFDAARDCYTETLSVSRRIGATFTEALAENNLGTLEYSLGDPGRALAHFQGSYAINMANDSLREAINAAHNVALCQTDLGASDRSLDLLDKVLQICRERGYREREYAVLDQKGRALMAQGLPGAAYRIFAGLATWPDSIDGGHVLNRVMGQAQALQQLGRADEGRDLLLASEAAARSYDEPILRLTYLARLGAALNETGRPRAALVRLGEAAAAAGKLHLDGPRLTATAAMAAAWRDLDEPDSALVAYRAAAAIWEHERGVPLDPEWRERRGLAGQDIYTEWADLVLGPEASDPAPDHIREAYQLLQGFKARTLFERMVGPQRTALSPPRPVSLGELQQALHPVDEVLLDYFIGRRHSLVFAVTRDGIDVCRLPNAGDLSGRVSLYRDLLAAAADGAGDRFARAALLTAGANALRPAVLGALSDTVATRPRVVFCPDGELNRLPLALVLAGGKAPDGHVVARVPSASILVRLRAAEDERSPARPVRRMLATAAGDRDQGPTLAAAAREVAWLRRRFAGVQTSLTAPRAAPDGLGAFDVIHVASHARVSSKYPWRSSIRVRTDPDSAITLTAAQIAASRLTAGVTVLAGCESAGGTVYQGEGVMGLGSAFLAAGSPAVVASLWPVDDAATFAFMRTFYAGLAAGRSLSGALVQAQADLAADERLADPVYWAGFVVIGDGRRTLRLTGSTWHRSRRVVFGTGTVLLCMAAAVGLIASRRKNL